MPLLIRTYQSQNSAFAPSKNSYYPPPSQLDQSKIILLPKLNAPTQPQQKLPPIPKMTQNRAQKNNVKTSTQEDHACGD